MKKGRTVKSMELNRINLIGVELEGGWNSKKPADQYWHHDGSVSVSARWVGEAASTPMIPKKLDRWLKANYPENVNSSCGLHVHISFRNHQDYQRLMVPRFHRELKEAFAQFIQKEKDIDMENLKARMAGQNMYCRDQFRASEQYRARYKDASRYCHLNYCYGLHGTLEFRMLPMFSKLQRAKRAIRFYLQFVEEWLEKAHARDAARAARLNSQTAEEVANELRAEAL